MTAKPIPSFWTPAPALAASRYNRQILVPSVSLTGQARILSTKVLIIGLGGLGSPASLYLAGAGVHTLGLLDHDIVDESNLHRQIVHRENSVGYTGHVTASQSFLTTSPTVSSGQESSPPTKAESALRSCRELNSKINYRTHNVRLSGLNALDIIRDYDLVLDCTDNPATRYLISDACVILQKILVSGAAQRLDGQVVVLNYTSPRLPDATRPGQHDLKPHDVSQGNTSTARRSDRGPCYRCVFPIPPSPEMVRGCNEIGILGPVVGTIGCLMASETLRIICKPDEHRKPTMLLYNAWSSDPKGMFRTIGLRGRRTDCLSCGDAQTINASGKQKITEDSIRTGSMDYEEFCGRMEDVALLNEDERISAEGFIRHLANGSKATVVDVREEFEVELGPKVHESIHIPISRILRYDDAVKGSYVAAESRELQALFDRIFSSSHGGGADVKDDIDQSHPVFFVCQRGNDSQVAVRKFLERRPKSGGKPGWIGDVRGGLIAIEKVAGNNT